MAKDLNKISNIVFICNGDSCLKKGAEENTKILRQTLINHNLHEETHTIKTRCTGQCTTGPIVFMYPEGIWYKEMNDSNCIDIVTNHMLKGQLLNKKVLFMNNPDTLKKHKAKSFIKRIFRNFLNFQKTQMNNFLF